MNTNSSNIRVSKYIPQVFANRYVLIAAFSLLTAVGAQVSIPVQPVPFTLQTMMVVLAGAFLGARDGAYSQVLYLLLGATGLPVFANGMFGLAVLFGPTGGYLLAFPLGAMVTGLILQRYQSYFAAASAMMLGNLAIIASGTLYLGAFFTGTMAEAVRVGAALFSIWAVAKAFVAAAVFTGSEKLKK